MFHILTGSFGKGSFKDQTEQVNWVHPSYLSKIGRNFMRILILTQWFDPEPAIKGLLFARELAARGHKVQVLTGFPNYPDGKVYPGYRIRPWLRETLDGIDVLRVALYPSHSKSGFLRFINYVSFGLSSALIGAGLIRKPDVIYVYHPPITVGMAAVAIKLLRGTEFVYDVQDLWPDTVAASGMMSSPMALRFLGRICDCVYKRASRIVTLSQGLKDRLVLRGIPADRINVVYNWCDETAMNNSAGAVTRFADADRFAILFAGTMGLAQGLESVLLAAQICSTTAPSAEFLFVGGGVDRSRLEGLAAEMRLDNVKFLPRQPMHAMGSILAGADVLLVHLKDDPLFQVAVPSKTQAYLAAGKPILMAARGEAAEMTTRSGGGIVCEPDNPQSLAAAVKDLTETSKNRLLEMGRSGKRFYDAELCLSAGVDKFESIFNSVASHGEQLRN